MKLPDLPNRLHELLGEPMVLVPEVAGVLRVHKSTIYRWIDEGILPAFEVDGVVRLLVRDVKAFIEAHTRANAKKGRQAVQFDRVAETAPPMGKSAGHADGWRPPPPDRGGSTS